MSSRQGLPIKQCPLRWKRKEKLLRKKIGLTKVECRGYCHSNAWLAELQTSNQTMLLGSEASAKLFIYNNYVSKCSLLHLIWVFHHCYTTTTKGHFTLRVKTIRVKTMKVWVQTTPY